MGQEPDAPKVLPAPYQMLLSSDYIQAANDHRREDLMTEAAGQGVRFIDFDEAGAADHLRHGRGGARQVFEDLTGMAGRNSKSGTRRGSRDSGASSPLPSRTGLRPGAGRQDSRSAMAVVRSTGTNLASRQDFVGHPDPASTSTTEIPPWRWYLMKPTWYENPSGYAWDTVWCESGSVFLVGE